MLLLKKKLKLYIDNKDVIITEEDEAIYRLKKQLKLYIDNKDVIIKEEAEAIYRQ